MEYVYAALLLHKLDKEVNEANLSSVVKASGAEVNEAQVKSLVAALADVNLKTKKQPWKDCLPYLAKQLYFFQFNFDLYFC
jgi:hypothetical protein